VGTGWSRWSGIQPGGRCLPLLIFPLHHKVQKFSSGTVSPGGPGKWAVKWLYVGGMCLMVCDMALCLQACASFCLLSQSCLSFQYSVERVDCVWFPSAQFDVISNNTGYWFYTKNSAEVTSSFNGFYVLNSLMFILFAALVLFYEFL